MRSGSALLLLASLACTAAFSPSITSRHTSPVLTAARRSAVVRADEYSNRVKVTAESKAPIRQARLFFFYPAVIAGASIGAYVSLTRVAAGMTVRPELDPLADGFNFAVNVGVVAAAVFFGMKDLKGREELLKEVAIELGELKPNPVADETPTSEAKDSDVAA